MIKIYFFFENKVQIYYSKRYEDPIFVRLEGSGGKKNISYFNFTMSMSIIHHTPFIWTSMYLL